MNRIKPNFDQYNQLVGSVLISRLAHALRFASIPHDVITSIRHDIVRGARTALRLPAAGAEENRADEACLAPVEVGGLGVPDLSARLTAEAACGLLWGLTTNDEDARTLTTTALRAIYDGAQQGAPPNGAAARNHESPVVG